MAEKSLINNICGPEATINQNPNNADDSNDPNEVDVIWPSSDYHEVSAEKSHFHTK